MFPFSVGEYIIRSASVVEQAFGGITTRLWDDPYEWTLPEKLATSELIGQYLDDVDASRKRDGFYQIRWRANQGHPGSGASDRNFRHLVNGASEGPTPSGPGVCSLRSDHKESSPMALIPLIWEPFRDRIRLTLAVRPFKDF